MGELLNAHTPAPPCGKTDVWANYVTHHTHALSYVAQKISQIMSRFVHIVLDDDGCVWSRWSTPTRVGVNISKRMMLLFYNKSRKIKKLQIAP